MSRKSAHHFVLIGFSRVFFFFFASGNVLLFYFRSSAPAISPVDLEGSSKLYPIYPVCDGVPESAWLVSPLFPLIFFFFPVSV